MKKGAVISELDYRNLPEEYEDLITVEMGGTALLKALSEIDMDQIIEDLKAEKAEAKGQRERKIV